MSGEKLDAIGIKEILAALPHRYPFLLVDRIIDIRGDEHGIGIKNVTINEPHFLGHFPNNPVMPGVLVLEGMAQTAGTLCIRALPGQTKPSVVCAYGEPNAVRVVVPLQEEPPSKIVLVSADVSEPPTYPYTIADIRVEPSQLKLLGRPERLINIATISTEPISAKTFTQNQTVNIRLNTPPDIGLRDDQDQTITTVKVTFIVKKLASSEDKSVTKPNPEESPIRTPNGNH